MPPRRQADALVIGGGIIGLLIARALHQKGLTVIVLDRDQPGRQASWAAAGIVGDAAPWDPSPPALLHRRSVALYPALAAALRAETGLDIEYTTPGWLIPALSPDEAQALHQQAVQGQAAGYDLAFVQGAELRALEPALGERVIGALLLPGGQVDNRRLVRVVEIALRQADVPIVSGAGVLAIRQQGGRVTGVHTLLGDFSAPVVVNAAGSWAGQIAGCAPPVPVVPQRGQILAVRQGANPLRRVVQKIGDPYLVPRLDGRIVVGATREYVGYDASLTAGGIAWLLQSALDLVPSLAEAPLVELWTGFRPMSPDGLPIIGPAALDGLYYATGHGPNGIGTAPATAEIVAALVTGAPSPIPLEPFSPFRFGEKGAPAPKGH